MFSVHPATCATVLAVNSAHIMESAQVARVSPADREGLFSTKGWGSFAAAATGLLPIAYRDTVAFAETQVLVVGYSQVTINKIEWIPSNVRLFWIRLDGDDRGFYAGGVVVGCSSID